MPKTLTYAGKVLNKHKDKIPADAIYIGRGSKWGNDWTHMPNTKAKYLVKSRDEACDCHAADLDNKIATGAITLQEMAALHGHDLVCYCAPTRCHGHTLLKKAQWAAEQLANQPAEPKKKMKQLTFAGIGSRETHEPILNLMTQIGHDLAKSGWLLRSGFADGADNAFAYGAEQANGAMELFIPWAGFNNASRQDARFIVPDFSDLQMAIAAKCHPAWNMCSPGAKKLHARNVNQVLGKNLDDPSDLIICWTPNGSGSGGTGQAIRIAKIAEVPVFDLAIPGKFDELVKYVEQLEKNNV